MTSFQPSDQVGVSCSQMRSGEGNSWCGLGCSMTSSRAQTFSTIPLDSLLQPFSSRCFQCQVVTVSVDHPFPVQDRGPHHVVLHIRSKSDQRLPRDAYWNFMSPNCFSQTRRKLPEKQSKSASGLGILLPKDTWRCVTQEGRMNTGQFSNDQGLRPPCAQAPK